MSSYLSNAFVSAGASGSFGNEVLFVPDLGFNYLFPELFIYEWNGVSQEHLIVKFKLYYDNGDVGVDAPPWTSPPNQVLESISFLVHIDGIWWNGVTPNVPKKPTKLGVSVSSDAPSTSAILSVIALTGKEQ